MKGIDKQFIYDLDSVLFDERLSWMERTYGVRTPRDSSFLSFDAGRSGRILQQSIPDPHTLDIEDQILTRVDGEDSSESLTLDELVRGLPLRTAEIVKAWASGQTQQEIADNLGISRSRVQELLSKASEHIKNNHKRV